MSVLRYDVTTNDWVIYAPARAQRPQPKLPRASSEFEEQGVCPFCPGNEALTPPEVDADRDGDGRWRVRVVPNKYPAFEAGTPNQHVQEGPMFRSMGGYGVHEALIESPEHDRTLGHQPAEQVERVLRAVHRRFIEHMRDPRLRAIVVFKNHGRRAGSTLKHPHWQIMATPIAPRLQRLKHAIATEHYDRTGDNLYRRLLEEEHAAQLRVLASNPDFTAVLPYASHEAFHVRILPHQAQASFANVAPHTIGALADLLRSVLFRLDAALDDPAYNLTLTTAPRGDEDEPYFLWHIDILPRLANRSGFELGSGLSVSTVLPEEAADLLRAAG